MFFSRKGILGQNARNLLYIKGEDFLAAKKIADSKLATKKYLLSQGVSVPETLCIFSRETDISQEALSQLVPPFVVKPNNGYGWKGILIIDSSLADGSFVSSSGEVFSLKDFQRHLEFIIDGFFSLSGKKDKVIIEKKIILSEEIDLLWSYGLPDIRIVSYNMVPVMAMIRIPTKASDGKANLHAGACAAGIDIGSWKITFISHRGETIHSIPGIWDIRGIVIPQWEKILSLAVTVQKSTGIVFLWCDVVLDKDLWPLLLEINVRPGLEIQNVNHAPLKVRLEKVAGIEVNSVEKGVRLGRDLFSGELEGRIEQISWKKIVGTKEYFKIFHNDREHQYIASLRLSETESFIDRKFLSEVLKIPFGEKTRIKLDGELLAVEKHISFKIDHLGEEKIVLWRNALKGFLIDPFKYKKSEWPRITELEIGKSKNTAIVWVYTKQLQDLDKKLMNIEKKLLILKYIRPVNIATEKHIFIEKKGDYIPRFEYNELSFDPRKTLAELEKIQVPDIPYSEIYARKKEEMFYKLQFFIAFQEQNTADMTLYSEKIFGKIHDEYFLTSKERIAARHHIVPEKDFLSFADVQEYLKKFAHIYHTKIRLKSWDIPARFTMKGDTLIMREDAKVGKKEIRAVIAHEIEGHYLRKLNGKKSDLSIMHKGGAYYIETDEGIAIYNQNRFLSSEDAKYYSLYERYYFLYYGLKHSYKKFISHLAEYYHHDYEKVFRYMLRVKRGFEDPSKDGACMKDVVYVNGYHAVEEYILNGWSIEDLYLGKLHIWDIQALEGKSIFTEHKKDIQIPFSL